MDYPWCEHVYLHHLLGVLSITLTMLWVTSGHWILLDCKTALTLLLHACLSIPLNLPISVVGVAISVFMIQFVRVPSLKLSSVFLMALLLYDIFWV